MDQALIDLDAKKSAHQLLNEVWGGRGFPVDPIWIAEELGVTVLETELPDNVLGGLVKDADKDPVILINRFDTDDHKRFNCAQKIGHYVDLMMQDADCYKYVDFRMQQANFAASADQIFANYFGESLLMPEMEVRTMAEDGASLEVMAKHFGVTEDAMEYRLKSLGVLLPAAA
ncbi:MAG: ImmA/IrrE family metallo-endopeptidase [Burkholderiales bacterium]|nr:ImmA/IrrE family metallo-endopeptidase [Burkholderiales bacterium]